MDEKEGLAWDQFTKRRRQIIPSLSLLNHPGILYTRFAERHRINDIVIFQHAEQKIPGQVAIRQAEDESFTAPVGQAQQGADANEESPLKDATLGLFDRYLPALPNQKLVTAFGTTFFTSLSNNAPPPEH